MCSVPVQKSKWCDGYTLDVVDGLSVELRTLAESARFGGKVVRLLCKAPSSRPFARKRLQNKGYQCWDLGEQQDFPEAPPELVETIYKYGARPAKYNTVTEPVGSPFSA